MRRGSAAIMAIVLFFALLVIPAIQKQGSMAIAKDIKWGGYTDLTGPIATTANNMWIGFQVYHNWLAKYDPIPGINIKLLWQDTGYSAPKYLTAFKKFKGQGVNISYNTSSTADVTLHKLHAKYKIPMVKLNGYKPSIVPPSYTFSVVPLYVSAFAGTCIHFMKEWKQKGMTRKPRIMFITWDVPYGRAHIPEGEPWAKEYGFEMLPSQFFSTPRPTDLTLQLLKAKEMGADLVYMNSVAGHFAVLLKDAQKLGLLDKMQLCVGSGAGLPELIRLAGSAAEGAWAALYFPAMPNKTKGYKWIVDEFKRQGKPFKTNDSIAGACAARIGTEAVRAAAKKVGPANLDNDAIYDALMNLKNLDMWGLMPNVSYAPDLRIPYNYIHIWEAKNQKWHDEAYVKTPWFAGE